MYKLGPMKAGTLGGQPITDIILMFERFAPDLWNVTGSAVGEAKLGITQPLKAETGLGVFYSVKAVVTSIQYLSGKSPKFDFTAVGKVTRYWLDKDE